MEDLEQQMNQAADAMDFEAAAQARDRLVEFKAIVEGGDEAEIMKRLKKGARRGSTHATRRRPK